MSFIPRMLLRRPKFWLGVFIIGFIMAMLPAPAAARTLKLPVFLFFAFIVWPLSIYTLLTQELDACLMRAFSVNDIDDLTFNYVTGAVLIAEVPARGAAGSDSDDRVIVGFCAYRALSAGGRTVRSLADLRYLYVCPGFRRRGVSSLLLSEAYEHASQAGYKGMMADVDAAHPLASHASLIAAGFRFYASDADAFADDEDEDPSSNGRLSALSRCGRRLARAAGCSHGARSSPVGQKALFAVPRLLSFRGRKLTYERPVLPPWTDDGDGNPDGAPWQQQQQQQQPAARTGARAGAGGKFAGPSGPVRALSYGPALPAAGVSASARKQHPRLPQRKAAASAEGSQPRLRGPAAAASGSARGVGATPRGGNGAAGRGGGSAGRVAVRDANEALAQVMGDIYGTRPEERFDGSSDDDDDDNGGSYKLCGERDDDEEEEEEEEAGYEVLDVDDSVPLRPGVAHRVRHVSAGAGERAAPSQFWRPSAGANVGPRRLDSDATGFERYMAMRAGADAEGVRSGRYTIERNTVDDDELVKKYFG